MFNSTTFDSFIQFNKSPRRKDFVFGMIVILLVFSTELVTFSDLSQYASINTEDIAVLLLVMYLIYSWINSSKWELILSPSYLYTILVLVTLWLVITLLVAYFRSGQSVLLSSVWLLKWFEGLVFLVALQAQIDRKSAIYSIQTIVFSGILIASYGLFVSDAYRFRLFFDNPNTLASFFVLVILLLVGKLIVDEKYYYIPLIGIVLMVVFSIGSRSGLLALTGGLIVLVLLLRQEISVTQGKAVFSVIVASLVITPFIIPQRIIHRLVGWIRVENGILVLADNTAAQSFKTRVGLIREAWDLFITQPIFGYGWYASPSRLGYFDVHYTTLLVELGIIGFVLMVILYLSIVRTFLIARQSGTVALGSAGVAWYLGILLQSIGGNFVRVPQMVMLTFLILISVWTLSQKDNSHKQGVSST